MDTIRVLLFCTPPLRKSPYTIGFFGFSHTNTCSSRLFIHAHPVDFRPLTAKHPFRPTLKSCARWGNRVRDGSNRVRDGSNRVRDGSNRVRDRGNRVRDRVIVCEMVTATNWKLPLFHAFIFSNRNSLISVRRITIPSPCMFRLLHGYKAYTRIFHTSSSLPDCDPTRRARLMNSRPAVPVYSSHGLPQTQNPFFFPTRISAGLRGTHSIDRRLRANSI